MVSPVNPPLASDLLDEAQERAVDYARESAFLGLVPPAPAGLPDRLLDLAGRPFGPGLCKLTPWRHHLLLGYASPYVIGGPCRRRHLWQALYLSGPAFRPGSRLAFVFFQLRTFWFVTRRFKAASIALRQWLDAPFAFMPPMPTAKADGTGGRPEADIPWLVSLMQLGRHAGFQPMEVIHLPYTILWSSVDSVLSAKDRNRPKFNRKQDKARGEYLRSKTRRNS